MNPSPQKKFTARVIASERIAFGVVQITFKITEPFAFDPWNYVWVEIPDMNTHDPKGNRRAFSIVSTINAENTISIVARTSESGYKQQLFALKQGDSVNIHGPFGSSFVVDEHSTESIVMIAGGIGIAAFLPLIRTMTQIKSPQKIFFIYTNKSPESTPYIQELNDLKAQNQSFDFIVKYEHFHWWDITPEISSSNKNVQWWIAGPQGMIDHTFSELERGGVSRLNMVFEENYPTPKNSLTIDAVNEQLKGLNLFAKGIENSTNHTVITNPEGVILFANKAAQVTTGYTLEEILGNTPRLWGGMMSRDFYIDFWNKKSEGLPFSGEIVNRRKNGEIYYSIAHIAPILNNTNEIIGFIGTEEDITQLKTREIEGARDKAILESMGEGLVIVDLNGKIIKVNKVFELLTGWTSAEVIGENFLTKLPMVDDQNIPVPHHERSLTKVLSGQINQLYISSVTNTRYYIIKNGDKLPISGVTSSVSLNDVLIGAVVLFQNITKEKNIDRMKTDFISLASHQLRTPLSAMKWFCEMLLNGDAGQLNKEQKEFTQNISESNQRMIELVNSLLNISRIESGRIIIDPKPTDIAKLITEIVNEVKIKSDAKHQTIIYSVHPELPLINVDPQLLRQVYLNLLTNASKYSPDGGEINVFVSRKGDKIISQISDNGFGILKKDKDRIFTKFYRGENILKVETDGTGLGLYLVKAIIDSSQGEIWYESRTEHDGDPAEKQGTTFWFTIPLSGMKKKEGEVSLGS